MNLQTWPIEKIKPYELNAKKHEPEQINGIAQSIKQFGFDQPIVVDRHGTIIKGHGRRLAIIQLGLKEALVLIRDDLNDDQVRAARLADNRVALGDIDTALMRLELQTINLDLLGGIFDPKELEFGTVDLGEMKNDSFITDVDGAVEKQDAATKDKIALLAVTKVPLVKVLGFKEVLGADEIFYSRFVALCEIENAPLKGEAAVTAYVKKVIGPISQG